MANKRFYQTPGGIKQYNLPDLVQAQAAPTTSDRYQVGTLWVNEATGNAYQLTQYSAGNPVWSVLGGATGAVATLTGDAGVATPVAGNINILTGANLTSAGAADDITVSLDTTITGLTSVTSTSFVTGTAATATTYTANSITATGTDAAINLVLAPKGTGDVTVTVGDVIASAGDIIATRSSAGADVTLEATNSDNTDGASRAGVEIATGGSSSGDPYLSFQISGVAASTMTMGLDNSASDLFVISNSTAIGTSNALTLSQAGALGATTTITAGTDIISTAGNIEIQGAAKQLRVEGGAVTDFIGQATLALGTVTVLNTNIAAGDKIFVSRQGINGSTALGVFDVAITPATSFSITARNPTDATTQTNDTSIVDYFIVRQL